VVVGKTDKKLAGGNLCYYCRWMQFLLTFDNQKEEFRVAPPLKKGLSVV